MSDPAEVFVPIVAILVIFGLPLSYAIVNRVFAHQERIEMIRRGVMPPPDTKWAKRMGAYAAPPSGYAPGYDPYEYSQWQANRSLRKGITLAMIGFALLVGLSFIDIGQPGPWLLGGLIPLFVGVAQIIIALMSGARITPFGGYQPPPHFQQPGAQQQQQEYQAGSRPFTAPPPNAPSGPAGWRPGPTTELEKPAQPPDKY